MVEPHTYSIHAVDDYGGVIQIGRVYCGLAPCSRCCVLSTLPGRSTEIVQSEMCEGLASLDHSASFFKFLSIAFLVLLVSLAASYTPPPLRNRPVLIATNSAALN